MPTGFFHTGDLARFDAAGWLHFLGRLKDVIKTAGVNVAAAEVEAALQEHPGVTLACVVGVPHAARGENVAAFVVRRDPGCSEDDVLAFCRTRLASYKVPRHVFFSRESDLPVLGSGKVDKRALRALAAERRAAALTPALSRGERGFRWLTSSSNSRLTSSSAVPRRRTRSRASTSTTTGGPTSTRPERTRSSPRVWRATTTTATPTTSACCVSSVTRHTGCRSSGAAWSRRRGASIRRRSSTTAGSSRRYASTASSRG